MAILLTFLVHNEIENLFNPQASKESLITNGGADKGSKFQIFKTETILDQSVYTEVLTAKTVGSFTHITFSQLKRENYEVRLPYTEI